MRQQSSKIHLKGEEVKSEEKVDHNSNSMSSNTDTDTDVTVEYEMPPNILPVETIRKKVRKAVRHP